MHWLRGWLLWPAWLHSDPASATYSQAVWPWTSYLTSLDLNFLFYKMGIIIVPTHRVLVKMKWFNIYTMLRIYIKHLIKGNGSVDDDDNGDDLRRKDTIKFRVMQSQGPVQVLLCILVKKSTFVGLNPHLKNDSLVIGKTILELQQIWRWVFLSEYPLNKGFSFSY